jgi:hypothetical protein
MSSHQLPQSHNPVIRAGITAGGYLDPARRNNDFVSLRAVRFEIAINPHGRPINAPNNPAPDTQKSLKRGGQAPERQGINRPGRRQNYLIAPDEHPTRPPQSPGGDKQFMVHGKFDIHAVMKRHYARLRQGYQENEN